MEKEKKRQLYEWFSFLGIEENEFKEFYNKWKNEFDEKEYEKILPEIPEKKVDRFEQKIDGIERVIDAYLKEEHSKKEIRDFIQFCYMQVGYNKEQARKMVLSAIIFSVVSPAELVYLMESVTEKTS